MLLKNTFTRFIISGVLSGLCIYGDLLLIIGPGIIFGFFLALRQPFAQSIYKIFYIVTASCITYYLAMVLAIHKIDYLSFLLIDNNAKQMLRLITSGLFGSTMLWGLMFSLRKNGVHARNSILTIVGGGITGFFFYYGLNNGLGSVLSFALWQTTVGVGLCKSFE